ncbi:MAG: AEC family transporter [Lachnospira sp.]|nr:AEC family transporter [Lachnospira sp.]
MDSFIYSINSTVPIFLVMILGWLIKQWGIIDDNFVNKANKYVFSVALPVMVFEDIAGGDIRSRFDIRFVLYCMIVTIVCFVGIWMLTELFMKDDTMKGSFVQGSFRSSAAILGIAFIQNMYDSSGMAPLMIVSAVPLYNIFAVIVLTFKASSEDGAQSVKPAENIKKACVNILKNPIIIGIFLGMFCSLIRVDFPIIIDRTVEYIGRTATPIALIVIGAGFEGRKAIKKIKPTVVATFIKLIGQAAVFLPVAIWMGFRNQELMAILIMLASPATVSGYIMAKNMNNDGVLASSIIVLSTLLSALTLTGWIFLLRMWGYL